MLRGDPDDDSDDICQALYVNSPSTELGVGSFFLQEKNTASDATVKKERNVLSVFIIRLGLKFGLKFVARQGGGGGGEDPLLPGGDNFPGGVFFFFVCCLLVLLFCASYIVLFGYMLVEAITFGKFNIIFFISNAVRVYFKCS